MSSSTIVSRHLRRRLVEDNPGVHVYRFVCDGCGRECGPEFTECHMSCGGQSDSVPAVAAECDCAREAGDGESAMVGRAVA